MKTYYQITLGVIIFCIILLSGFSFFNLKNNLYENTFFKKITYGNIASDTTDVSEKSLYFVGDIMLARHVEYLMSQNGHDYPYRGLNFLDKENAFVIGNFEASVPKVHQKTPNYTFRFSVDEKYLPALNQAGFTHLSLANNHSFDFGSEGYKNTTETLKANNMTPFGHPTIFSTSSVTFINTGTQNISFVALHTLYVRPTREQIDSVISWANDHSDYTIVYIHWGNEYELNQSVTQRQLAKTLIEAGTDLIVGHHPHVVQGIEKIDNSLVFYSLGNLIFDQYFNEQVRSGLIIKLNFSDNLDIELVPVDTKRTLAQPHKTDDSEKNIFLTALASRSSAELREEIIQGKITHTLNLATSTEKVIIE